MHPSVTELASPNKEKDKASVGSPYKLKIPPTRYHNFHIGLAAPRKTSFKTRSTLFDEIAETSKQSPLNKVPPAEKITKGRYKRYNPAAGKSSFESDLKSCEIGVIAACHAQPPSNRIGGTKCKTGIQTLRSTYSKDRTRHCKHRDHTVKVNGPNLEENILTSPQSIILLPKELKLMLKDKETRTSLNARGGVFQNKNSSTESERQLCTPETQPGFLSVLKASGLGTEDEVSVTSEFARSITDEQVEVWTEFLDQQSGARNSSAHEGSDHMESKVLNYHSDNSQSEKRMMAESLKDNFVRVNPMDDIRITDHPCVVE